MEGNGKGSQRGRRTVSVGARALVGSSLMTNRVNIPAGTDCTARRPGQREQVASEAAQTSRSDTYTMDPTTRPALHPHSLPLLPHHHLNTPPHPLFLPLLLTTPTITQPCMTTPPLPTPHRYYPYRDNLDNTAPPTSPPNTSDPSAATSNTTTHNS